MSTRHFINDPQQLVTNALQSIKLANPSVSLDLANRIVYAPGHATQTKVANLSGGGSGHEPSFTGFVGRGMLTAAVAGNIFASPSSRQILAAIEGVPACSGMLITVMRYTGDVLNFGVASEKAKAQHADRNIKMLVIGDDVGVPRSKMGRVGRRGVAGLVLVHKVTGALADLGYSLDEVYRVGKLVGDNMVSVGVSLDKAHVPGRTLKQEPNGILVSGEMELGMGIHNEPGCARLSGPDAELSAVVSKMLEQMLSTGDEDRSFLPNTTPEMVLMINNMGGLSVLELSAIATEVSVQIQKTYHKTLVRIYTGTYMTSLNGPGFSITLLNHVTTGLGEGLLTLLDHETDTLGWHAPQMSLSEEDEQTLTSAKSMDSGLDTPHQLPDAVASKATVEIIGTFQRGLRAVVEAEPEVTQFDTIVGDGDCGLTLKRGAEAISKSLEKPPTNAISLLSRIADAVEQSMDGTSGAIYSIFLNALVQHFVSANWTDLSALRAKDWAEGLTFALNALSKYTPARVGDRTVIDALVPFIEELRSSRDSKLAAYAAMAGATATKNMAASLGRAVYVGMEDEWKGKIPDPGAWGLARFLMALCAPDTHE